MTTLQDRQSKIQDKRKQTPWREFIREVASLFPLNFYKNNNLISVYPPSPRVTVISPKEYSHRGSNNMNSSIWDHEGSFFEKLSHLVQNNPTPSVIHFRENDNVDYANCVFWAKNVYLSFAIWEETENCFYSAIVYKKCSNIFSSVAVTNYCENIYNAKAISKSSFIFYSKYIHNSSNIRFSTNLIGCHNCFRCDALENMSYCIDNTPYSKDEYYKKVHILLQDKNNFEHYFKQLRNEAINYASTKVLGNRILESHNISSWYIVSKLNHGRNNLFVEGVDGCEDFYDVFEVGVNAKHFYAVCNGGSSEHVYCSNLVENSQNIYYSFYIDTCSFCLGCIGLRNKSYCIFNQQYTKDERE